MRVVLLFVPIVITAVSLASCSAQRQAVAPVVPGREFTPQPETGPYVVMGHLRHRDRIVTIKSGEQGTVYSVQNADGKILFENLTAAQLKSQAPEIHDVIYRAEAGYAGLREYNTGLPVR
jgi:hypothetical protein